MVAFCSSGLYLSTESSLFQIFILWYFQLHITVLHLLTQIGSHSWYMYPAYRSTVILQFFRECFNSAISPILCTHKSSSCLSCIIWLCAKIKINESNFPVCLLVIVKISNQSVCLGLFSGHLSPSDWRSSIWASIHSDRSILVKEFQNPHMTAMQHRYVSSHHKCFWKKNTVFQNLSFC